MCFEKTYVLLLRGPLLLSNWVVIF